ncbi:MAG: 1-acyl-sn-glycerol-3-phosphate acyltransferase [Ruminococcaceae bacterium]|nr:1-acyl-sn-glycerol-3-phosphate acyltransferase [Oscillospiraceae bacterium]
MDSMELPDEFAGFPALFRFPATEIFRVKKGGIPMKDQKKQPWLRRRHRIVRTLLYPVIGPIARRRYGVTIRRCDDRRQCLILLNHTTAWDQFFVDLSFRRPIYYMATEDIFSMGWLSKVIRWLVAPIPIRKQTTDVQAVMTCLRVAKEGGTLCIAPEGNRTYSGETCYMNPAIAPLVKKLGLPIMLYRIEGGYGVQPRWSDVLRRGRMQAGVSRIIEPEEYAELSPAALFELIRTELHRNEAETGGEFTHPRLAEYLERMLYVCPDCGFTTFESHGDRVRCTRCGLEAQYLPDKTLRGIGKSLPYRTLLDWYRGQEDFVNAYDPMAHTDAPLYEDTVRLSEVIVFQRKNLLTKSAAVRLFGDRVELDGERYPFGELGAITVLGRNKCNIYTKDRLFQLKGDRRFNALKYVQLYNRYKNLTTGDGNGKFLGL